MATRRRLDQLARRMGNADGATEAARAQADYEAYQRARLASMTDDELQRDIEHLTRVLEVLDEAGALDDVLTRADLGLDD